MRRRAGASSGSDAQNVPDLAQDTVLAGHHFGRGRARHRLQPTHAGRHRTLFGHLEKPKLPCLLEVSTATQLRGKVADLHHAHAVPVLLAEEGHGARSERLLERHFLMGDRDVGLNLLVDQVRDLLDLAHLDAAAVREVEAQVIGRHQRAGLRHVGSEDAAEGRVQEVRPGVMLAQTQPARRLDADRHLLALPEPAGANAHPMDDEFRAPVVGVDDLAASLATGDGSGVSDLAARLGVGGGTVENDLDLGPGRRLADSMRLRPPWPGSVQAR